MIVGVLAAVVAYALLGPAGNFVYNYIGLVFGPATLAAMKAGAVFGAVMGAGGAMISGGSFKDILTGALKGALFGAISAGVASGIGDVMGHSISFLSEEGTFIEALQKAILHGLSRGVINTAQGGKFGAGFASGFISSGFAVGKNTFESLKGAAVAARTAVMAVVGGVTSEITGGKFANGAITGAFVHLFNAEDLGRTGNTIRDISGKLNSDFEKRMFAQYWKSKGDYELTTEEFNNIMSKASVKGDIGENSFTITLYNDATYNYAIGDATIYYSNENSTLVFYDYYNFNSANRAFWAEFATRATNFVGSIHGATPFNIYYMSK